MDWSDYDDIIIINNKYSNIQDNYKVKYGIIPPYSRFEFEKLDLLTVDEQIIKYVIVSNIYGLIYDINKYIIDQFNWINKNITSVKIHKIEDITFINNYIFIPLLSSDHKRKNIEIYDICIEINISIYNNIYIYYEKHNIFENIIKTYFNINIVTKNNKNVCDLFISDAYDAYDKYDNDFDCHWLFYRCPWYINLLNVMSKCLQNNGSCLLPFDIRYLKHNIYIQILKLYSCFMNIQFHFNLFSWYPKFFIHGTNIDIKKLKQWCSKHYVNKINEYDENLFKIVNTTTCINIEKIITDLNIDISGSFETKISEIYNRYYKYQEQKLNVVLNPDISIKYIIKKSVRDMYEHLKKKRIPFQINPYYVDKPKKIIFSLNDINKLYFPDILNINFNKLTLTPSALYSVTFPLEAKKITEIIYDIVGNVKIVDACANCGGNTISFAQKFKKVVSIEITKHNYEALKNNVKEYGLDNVKIRNMDCLEYFEKHKINTIFFDPQWGGNLINTNNIDIRISGIRIDDVIINILSKNKKANVFLKVPRIFKSELEHTIFKIKNYMLLYFHN
jgi:predicted RNA methylase